MLGWGKVAATLADIFRCNFVNETFLILIKNSLNFVPEGPIDNKSSLVQVMAWRLTGDKSLREPMIVQVSDTYVLPGLKEFMHFSNTVCTFYHWTVWCWNVFNDVKMCKRFWPKGLKNKHLNLDPCFRMYKVWLVLCYFSLIGIKILYSLIAIQHYIYIYIYVLYLWSLVQHYWAFD